MHRLSMKREPPTLLLLPRSFIRTIRCGCLRLSSSSFRLLLVSAAGSRGIGSTTPRYRTTTSCRFPATPATPRPTTSAWALACTGGQLRGAWILNVHTTRYDLDQENYVEIVTREQDEQCSIWTLSTGLGFSFNACQVRYVGRLTLGSGQPGVMQNGNVWMEGDAAMFARSSNFIVAPTGSLTLSEARVFTHQVSILVPLIE